DVQGIGGKGEDANIGITEDLELRDAVDPFNQGSSRIHNYAREARVTFGAEEIQDGPGRRKRPSGTATCERRRAVEAAGPVADGEELVPAWIAVAVEDDGGAAGRVGVLGGIGGVRGGRRQQEVP